MRVALPRTIAGYALRSSGFHQLVLAILSVMVFGISAVPLELQRRIINDAINSGTANLIIWLAAAYAGVAVLQNVLKLGLNVYRGWVSERAVRRLRQRIVAHATAAGTGQLHSAEQAGVEIAMVLSEAEPIGQFVGISLSEPLLQGGVLLSVIGYMTWLEPWMGALSIAFLLPQLLFVPPLQAMINRRAERRIGVLRTVGADMLRTQHEPGMRNPAVDQVFALNMGIFKIKYTQNFLMNVTYHCAVAVALGVGGYLAVNGRIEIGAVVATVAGLGRLNDPWGDLVTWWREMAVVRMKYRLFVQAVDQLEGSGDQDFDPHQCPAALDR
ncbi:MAG: ABC transporter ATP-binding protein [Alphaproteobacteria bacterium]|nr:ABC transporter ATP-binding protein [Alphaproteobacteria bacterium]